MPHLSTTQVDARFHIHPSKCTHTNLVLFFNTCSMGRKVEKMIAKGDHNIDPVLLTTYKKNLANRVLQVDKGVFQWGVITAKKPSA